MVIRPSGLATATSAAPGRRTPMWSALAPPDSVTLVLARTRAPTSTVSPSSLRVSTPRFSWPPAVMRTTDSSSDQSTVSAVSRPWLLKVCVAWPPASTMPPSVTPPNAWISTRPPDSSLVTPAAVMPATVSRYTDTKPSSAPGTPVLTSRTDLAAAMALFTRICWPAVTVTVESGPSQVTPVSPRTPPAVSAPCSSTSAAPVMLMCAPACCAVRADAACT